MNLRPVFRFVSYAHFILAVTMIAPWILASDFHDVQVSPFAAGFFVAVVIGAMSRVMEFGMARRPPIRNGFRELLLSLLVFWAILPMVAAIPFALSGYRPMEAWFEAVSAITTTGAWLSEPAARATEYGMVYRASLQALGGLASLATAAAVFVRPEFIGVATMVPPFARGEKGSYLRAFDRAVGAFVPVYMLFIAIGTLGFFLVKVPFVEAITMSMSFLATGGFVPAAGGLVSFGPGAVAVGSVLMVLGAVNFLVLAAFILGQTGRVRSGRDPETKTFLFLIPFVAILFWLSRGAGDVDKIWGHVFNAVSLLSTNGPTLGEVPGLTPVLVTAVIGGAAVSTAGGIKILRWLITFRRTGEEIWKLTHPGAVSRAKPSANELGVWIHALAFTILLAAMVLITAGYGFPLETSAAAAVGVLANVGPVLDLAPQGTADYGVFDPSLRMVFGVGMIAGRLELVILLVLLSRRFWQG